MTRQTTAAAGKHLGRYIIERELGRGGMGVVYLALDEKTNRRVALKTTSVAGLGGGSSSRNQRRARFVREVQALTHINHENVVHVFDAGEADDTDLGWLLYYSMDFVDGLTLAQLVQQRGALDPRAAAAVVMQVAAGLGAAHKAGIVHRDVKPANIFISNDQRALIGDFGICKIEGSTQITRRDQLVGTPNYLAPEQVLGDSVSPATDVFALGALFYVITMNRPLRAAVDATSLLKSAQGDEPKLQMMAEASVQPALRTVIARALERDPRRRYADGTALAEALADHATEVPRLGSDATNDAAALRPTSRTGSSTGDHESPFATATGEQISSVSSAEVEALDRPDADVDAVELAARALLGEVDNKFAHKGGQKPDRSAAPKAPALPVARTESTVMFNLGENLRAVEVEKPASKAAVAVPHRDVPEARTESTAMFSMREEGRDAGVVIRHDAASASAALSMPNTDAAENALHEATPAADNTGEGLNASDKTPLARRVEGAAGARRAPPRTVTAPVQRFRRRKLSAIEEHVPRRVLLASALGLGLMCGLIAAAAMAPDKPRVTAASGAAASSVVELARRPAICPEVAQVSDADKKKAQTLVDEAQAIKQREGGTPSAARDMVADAIRINRFDARAYFLYGTLLAGQDVLQRDAYLCVCLISEGSNECQSVKRTLGIERITLLAP